MAGPIPMEGTSLTELTSHYALLEDAVATQLGPVAGRVVRKLGERGAMTLKELSQSLLSEPFQASTTALEAARMVGSNLATGAGGGAGLEPTALIDTAVKEIVARLVLHRIVAAAAHQATYELRIGSGVLLHVLHPLIAQAARSRYGPAGEALTLVIRQLAVVPLDVAAKLTRERCPSIPPAQVDAVATSMDDDGWVESVSGEKRDASTADVTTSRGRKRGRGTDDGGEGGPSAVAGYACRLCLPVVLRELLHDALGQWVAEHFPDTGLSAAMATALLRTMHRPVDAVASSEATSQSTHRGLNNSGEDGILLTNPFGFPPLALSPFSESVSAAGAAHLLSQVYEESHETNPFAYAGREDVAAALRKLATPTSSNGGLEGPILRSSSGADAGLETYSLSLSAVVSALQFDCCERTIFSRHGVLGVRLMKLLLKHHLLEDRTLAEEAVATQPRTRHTLSAMMRDGYVYQQEVPRAAITGDRQPKNSTFLWGCSMRQSLSPAVREHLANSLLHALAKLREVVYTANEADRTGAERQAEAALPQAVGVVGVMGGVVQENGALAAGGEKLRCAIREQRNAIGLESCAMALMRMLVLMDYYQ